MITHLSRMKITALLLIWCSLLAHSVISTDIQNTHEEEHLQNANKETDSIRDRRGVIEEERFYNTHSETRNEVNPPTPWLPGHLQPEDPTTKISITNNEDKEVLPLYQTTEPVTDKPTGRGARASNENWIKLPYPPRDEAQRDEMLVPPKPSGELINSRMPRVNFVTQNKQLEASESRNDKTFQRPAPGRTEELRTEFVRPREDERAKQLKPVYPRQAAYYPEESRRFYYDDRYIPADPMYRVDPYYDLYDRRRNYQGYVPTIDRYDEVYDNYVPRKPKRIIYYAHLPEVVRTPPSVDLRYRYSVDPYRRVDDDYYARNGRYDFRFRNRQYPYAPLRKEERNYRDLAGAGTVNKEKKEEKLTPTPISPEKDEANRSNNVSNKNTPLNRNIVNSHQYHDGVETNYDALTHKGFQDVVRPSDPYIRYEEPLFQRAIIEDPYQRKY